MASRRIAPLFLLAAVFSGAQAAERAPEAAPEGARAYEARCAKCHKVADLVPRLAKRRPDARVAYLEKFLARHYAPDPAERKAIAAWLAEQR